MTPEDPEQRGAQVSIKFSINVEQVHEELEKRGIVVSLIQFHKIFEILKKLLMLLFHFKCDYRKPNVLRFAPAPLYNTFSDVYKFIQILDEIMQSDFLKNKKING